jgi:glycosyltransferase involved in cell wall biosynthesis
MPKPIHVAYLCEFPTLLGGERSLLAFLTHRAEAAVRPIVVAPAGGRLAAALAEAGIERIDWPKDGRHDAGALADVLRDRSIDIVHANSLMTVAAASAVGDVLGIPAVAHVRDIMTLSAAQRDRINRLAGVVAVSDAVAERLAAQGIDRQRITRIYNAIDLDRMQRNATPGTFRRELAVGNDRLVGCIGQIALRKGQDLFLDAAARVAGQIADARFVIAGERYSNKPESRAFEADLVERANTPPLACRTHLLGYRDDIPSLLTDLDVLVVPSRQEPLSRVLLEGLATGAAAVATAVGGTPEILVEGEHGLMVPPDDPERMAEAITRLLGNPSMCDKMRTAGPPRAREMFSPPRQIEALRKLYDRIMK